MVPTVRLGFEPENGPQATNDGWEKIAADVKCSPQTTYGRQRGC